MTLKELLIWVTTTGSGVIAYFIADRWRWLSEMDPWRKRVAVILMTGLLAVAAWLLQIAMTYVPYPMGWRAWVEAAVAVLAVAFTSSQVVHGVKDLRGKIRSRPEADVAHHSV